MMYVKGIDNHDLRVENNRIWLGDNNRSWIHEKNSTTTELPYPYYHDYMAGTLQVTVDLSEVECSCATGLYLVDTSMPGCDSNSIDGAEAPQCSRIELMEANKYGFSTALSVCDSSDCPSEA